MNKRPIPFKLDELTEHDIEMMNRITRRRFIGAGGVAIGTALAGCAAPPARQAAPTAASVGYPRTIKHAGGETVINTPPIRIISALTNFELDTLLALGVKPVARGANPTDGMRPWTAKMGGNDVPMVEVAEDRWNLESLTQLQADVIFLTGYAKGLSSELSRVDPTIVLPIDDIAGQLRIVSETLNIESSKAAAILADIERTYDSFKAPRIPKSIVFFQYGGEENMILRTDKSPVSTIFQRVGLSALTSPTAPETQERKDFVFVSLEEIKTLEADLLLAATYSDDDAVITDLEKRPIFQNLDVVKAGRYRRLTPDEAFSLLRVSPLTPPFAVKTLERVLQP